ncbi:MAG: sulfite exporter TauE/SafE family protein [Bacteriovoracaceae bacterium]|nr:sulfite exporter TauE/SafE family protein [Bacteriovoracaceae bacterium]
MEIIGFAGVVLMGLVLGLVGGGGSIMTVPILVYLFNQSPSTATAYSLFIVGLSASVASISYFKKKQIDFKVGFIFAVPAFIGVYITRKFLLPALPETLLTIESYSLTKDGAIMLLFVIAMLLSSISMIKGRKDTQKKEVSLNPLFIGTEGIVVGIATGMIGAGGGFLIIPALVVLAGLEMKIAVGTSLMIISIKSLIGFIGDVQVMPNIDWSFLLNISLLSFVGIFVGTLISSKVKGSQLKRGFGYFVLLMGAAILFKEVYS